MAKSTTASAKPAWADKQVFTTGEAAEICKVSQQTIIRCFDNGRLQGFRVPGSRFRRIPRNELLRFMKANDIPTEIIETGKKRIMVVDDDDDIRQVVAFTLKSLPVPVDVVQAADGQEAVE
jgi:excisionase family DNA binding protein